METTQDFPEADEGAAVSQIIKEVADEFFEELANEAFTSQKFDPTTHKTMAEDIWELLTETASHSDPLSLNYAWMNTSQKSIHLASAINSGGINQKWVHSNVGNQWKGRQQSWKQAQRKAKRVSQRTSSPNKAQAKAKPVSKRPTSPKKTQRKAKPVSKRPTSQKKP